MVNIDLYIELLGINLFENLSKSKIYINQFRLLSLVVNMEKEIQTPIIELSGFKDIDSSSRDVIRKNVDAHARKLMAHAKKLQNLHITLKTLHQREKSEIYDIHARMKDNGKIYVSHVTDRNIFAAIDKAMEN